MTLISESYRQLLQKKHREEEWGRSAKKHQSLVNSLLNGVDSVIDYGCGKPSLNYGKVRNVQLYDPAVDEYSDTHLVPADIVLCIDVMEHVEEEYVDSVLQHIASLTKRKAFFVVHCSKAGNVLPDGTNAHITIRPPQWWHTKLKEYFNMIEVLPKVPNRPHDAGFICTNRQNGVFSL